MRHVRIQACLCRTDAQIIGWQGGHGEHASAVLLRAFPLGNVFSSRPPTPGIKDADPAVQDGTSHSLTASDKSASP